MTLEQVISEKQELLRLRKLVSEFGGKDIISLHGIEQPLVTDMQRAIRHQQGVINECYEAILYLLERIQSGDRHVCDGCGVGTTTFEKLTKAAATVQGLDVDQVRNEISPGSASIHRPRS